MNIHWTPIYRLCFPCSVRYTAITHTENLSVESADFFRQALNYSSLAVSDTKQAYHGGLGRPSTGELAVGMFGGVPTELVEKVYRVYENDFLLFNYSAAAYRLDFMS